MISFARRICCTDMEIARRGTSATVGKPSFVYLLLTASLIEVDNQIGILDVEIGRRIVESQVCVLTDSGKRQIDRLALQLATDFRDASYGVPVTIEEMIMSDSGLVDQPL